MTKLFQWLLFFGVYASVYFLLLSGNVPIKLDEQQRLLVMVSPVILIGLFGVYSVFTIAYRVATFNDCPEAAAELKKEIIEAKSFLSSKGMQFD